MMDNPLVSVIMLTYNHEKYIAHALDSVLMQEVNFNYEILIGDDCSTDGTQQILVDYQKKYPDKIILRLRQENIGATKNAYELLMMARGDYLATCEGDDYWTNKQKLQKQVDFLKENPQFIGCTHKFMIVDDQGAPYKKQRLNWVKQKEVFTFADFEGLYMPGQPSTFVRRNIFKNTTEDFSILYRADKDISDRTSIMIYLLQGDFYCFEDEMSVYRKNVSTGITKKVYSKLNVYEKDIELNLYLEEYASALLNRKIIFVHRRAMIYRDIIWGSIKNHKKELLRLLPSVKDGCRSQIEFYRYFFVSIFEKVRDIVV